jgi:hypothetical protein
MTLRNCSSLPTSVLSTLWLALAGAAYAQQVTPDVKPVIERAEVDTSTDQMVIQGTNLSPATGKPRVKVDGATMTLVSYDSTQIVTTFPSSLITLGGTFLVQVTSGGATGTFDLTIPTPPFSLPFSGSSATSSPSFSVTNTDSGYAVYAVGGTGVPGVFAGGGANTPSVGQGGAGIFGYGGISCSGSSCNNGPGGSFLGGEDSNFDSLGGDGVDVFGGLEGGEGIYAEGGGTGLAGEFGGNVTVHGNLSKSGGSFQIDHPLDPANKYLYHSFVESPDMKNIYDGNVITDGSGRATVTLPDWFEALNRDFRYQLTTIGQPAQVWVESKIANHSFSIRSDKPNVEVSWQVTGIRQDAWANAHRIPVEVEKAKTDQGHYLHPELFGRETDASIPQLHHPRPSPVQKQ